MSDAPKKGRLLQIHLSTLVLLVVAAALLLYLNIRTDWRIYSVDHRGRGESWVCTSACGWPWVMIEDMTGFPRSEIKSPEHIYWGRSPSPWPRIKPEFIAQYRPVPCLSGDWVWSGLLANLAVSVAILAVINILCEVLLRRRERRHE